MSEDLELFARWRAGDRDAGGVLLERHFRRIYRFFGRKIDQSDVVAELAQRTFLAALEGEHRIRDGTRFKAFMLGIARNLLAEHYRRRRQDERHKPALAPGPDLPSPSSFAAQHQEQRVLLLAIRELSLDLQLVLEMHYWEELTTAEIAQVLDISPSTVKWRLVKARELVRKKLQRLAHGPLRESTLQNFEQWAASLRTWATRVRLVLVGLDAGREPAGLVAYDRSWSTLAPGIRWLFERAQRPRSNAQRLSTTKPMLQA